MGDGTRAWILGIETSCDETAAAIVEGDRVLAESVASQDEVHRPYGGVVPELASRRHLALLGPLVRGCLRRSGLDAGMLDAVAVTRGPGLAGCLLAGVGFAKGVACGLGIPLIGVNHIEAHLFSCSLGGRAVFPAVALVVSGGHTALLLVRGWGDYRLLGRTLDDAVGEAYDKVASMMGLPFPGGPAIEERAARCPPGASVRFPRPLLASGDLQFSFSGLKTAVRYRLEGRGSGGGRPAEPDAVARGFQEAVVEVLLAKSLEAARRTRARCLMLAGGVARNGFLRGAFERGARGLGLPLLCAPERYCTDNGVMVAALAVRLFREGRRDDLALDIDPGLRLGEPGGEEGCIRPR
ncbi:MAG: tRNA (adenosine(37)-N6)-threonylcarbamoyltransferase complex transferase subunit TsaD [bacterium]|nr:tRNA (adenosine(37)-N6)-threonylcarbamoyltransferase complex transferase subunit TsaD [bacterium]